jgi:hypothetical protein
MDLEPSNQKSWCPWIWSQAIKSLGVHGFGAKQPKDLVSMDLEPSNQKTWCPWIWSQATKRLGVHGFGTKQLEDLVSMDLEPSIFFLTNVIESAKLRYR